MAYVVDSDVFIRAKNDHYGFSFCPAFWDWLLPVHHAGLSWAESPYEELRWQ